MVLMDYPASARSTLEAIYRLAAQVCAEIERFQPDVLVGLAHSGWAPVAAAQTLWAEKYPGRPFPPATRTNIGREKHEIYFNKFGRRAGPAFCCVECCPSSDRLGHYLAWVAAQESWLDTLRAQIQAVYPTRPARILVVDDLLGGYSSGYAALALLEALYPGVEVYLITGRTDLTNPLILAWLQEFIPLPEGASNGWELFGSPDPPEKDWKDPLKPLINGTEDISANSLEWKPLTADSRAVQALVHYLPAKQILIAPDWANAMIRRYVLQRQRGIIPDGEVKTPPDERGFSLSSLRLTPGDRLAQCFWLNYGVTLEDVFYFYGDTPEGRKAGMEDITEPHTWIQHEGVYYLVEGLESWITAYDLGDSFRLHNLCRKEVQPNLWVGAYPMTSDIRFKPEVFKDLLGQVGIDVFIDLSEAGDFKFAESYQGPLEEAAQACGRGAEVWSFPVPDWDAPGNQAVARALDAIEGALEQGRRIYLHSAHNLEGRTPMVLACWWVRQGRDPADALAEAERTWLEIMPFLIHSPLTERQRQFVLELKKGEG